MTLHTPSHPPTPCSLADIQGNADHRGIALQQAGVSNVSMPVAVALDSNTATESDQTVAARVNLSVGLPAEEKGAHMSRFVLLLNDWRQQPGFINPDLRPALKALAERLQAPTSRLHCEFPYFIDKASPVTELSAPFEVTVSFDGQYAVSTDETTLTYRVELPIATLCPCSKAISDEGAHNQRAMLQVSLAYMNEAITQRPDIETLITALDDTASCPVYPILKRPDEKWVTERQYNNPKFVEDVARDATLYLRSLPQLAGFAVRVEALESIHGHNAVAEHAEGVLAASNWQPYKG